MDITTINPNILPSLPLEQHDALPDCPAIYFVLTPDSTVLYIGKARRLLERWRRHHRYQECAAVAGVSIAWLVVSDTSLLDTIEDACIEYFSPTLNEQPVLPRSQWHAPSETVKGSGMHIALKPYLRQLEAVEKTKPASERRRVPSMEELAEETGIHATTLSRIANNAVQQLSLDTGGKIIAAVRRFGFPMTAADLVIYIEEDS